MSCKIFHKGKYYISFKRGFEDIKKDITVTIDKVFESDCLRILLSDDEDPTFLCILCVTRCDYEDLKKQQGLLIDFDNFPSQLVRLLQQCASNNMFLILQQANPIQFFLEIVEHNEFRRLVHLSLKAGPATDSDVKQHMAETINILKKSLSALKSTSTSTEVILNDKILNMEKKINDLTRILSKMEEDKCRRELEFQEMLKQEQDRLSQDKIQWQKNSELHTKAQLAASQESINRKDNQIDELNNRCSKLQDNIRHLEKQICDKSQRLDLLEKEVQDSHIAIATLNAKNASLDSEIIERDKQYKQLMSKCNYLEKTVKENNETITELNNSIQIVKREKTSLEERLGLSESLANKNNEVARSTSEQLLKANQIISKQNSDLIEMKEKLLCRTAIALEQEKVIESNTREMEQLKLEVQDTKQNMEKLESELQTLKERYESNETLLKERDETIKNNNMVIQWLHKKLEGDLPVSENYTKVEAGGRTTSTSTPYFLSRQNKTNSTQHTSDESINFYATSKLSNVEDSPVQVEKRNPLGLDPKYLKPATNDNETKSKSNPKPNLKSQREEKENKNVNLPKVNYREKKSGRGTYRATPVSAYFPR